MKVPKYIQEILRKRRKAAETLNAYDCQLVTWMEKQGMNTINPEIVDCIQTGAVEICEPYTAEQSVIRFIENFQKEDTI